MRWLSVILSVLLLGAAGSRAAGQVALPDSLAAVADSALTEIADSLATVAHSAFAGLQAGDDGAAAGCIVPAGVSAATKLTGRDFRRMAKMASDTLSAEFLDTVNVKKSYVINDYSMIGFNYGVTFSSTSFNPTKHGQKMLFTPNYMSLMYTKYCKMFGYIQNFGVTAGIEYGHEGYQFEPDEDGRTAHVDTATCCTMTLVDIPAMAQFHFDIDPVKIMIDLGIYAGYRQSIERSGTYLSPAYQKSWRDYEIRFDYGLKGGLGFAIMLDPVEIHLNAHVRWSWSSLYQPDYYSSYYYRFAYPLDIMVSAGIYYQITKRRGTTGRDIRRQAREQFYGKQE